MAEYKKLGKYIQVGDTIGGRRVISGYTIRDTGESGDYVATMHDDSKPVRFPLYSYVVVQDDRAQLKFAPVAPAVVDAPTKTTRENLLTQSKRQRERAESMRAAGYEM